MTKGRSNRFKSVGSAATFSGGQPIRYFKARPYAIGYNGRTGLAGDNWLSEWALPALKKVAVPMLKKGLKKHAPAIKKHGFAVAKNTIKNLRDNQGLFKSVKNALGTQTKKIFGAKNKKSIKAAIKRPSTISRRRNAKAKHRPKRKAKKTKRSKGGFKELLL